MARRPALLAVLAASVSLAACDSVVFPGFTDPDKAETPASETISSSADDDATSTETVPTDATTLPDESDVSPSEPEQSTPPDVPSGPIAEEEQHLSVNDDEYLSEYQGITDLLAINAALCASTGQETMTLAEQAGADVAAASVTPEAINGTAITTDLFPGIVKMEPRRVSESGTVSSGHCGATRIANNWFITASHCLDQTYDEIRLIATDSNIRDPRAQVFEANATICHSAYGGRTGGYSNDVALVGVSDTVAEALTSVPIARFGATEQTLGPVNYPLARMAGWGLTDFNRGELSNTLLQADLTMVSAGPAAITVAGVDGAGPCVGDSGGPLLVDEADGASRVIGVLSVVEQNSNRKFCEGQYNARYTNLAGYLDWIETAIGVCSANPDLCARR